MLKSSSSPQRKLHDPNLHPLLNQLRPSISELEQGTAGCPHSTAVAACECVTLQSASLMTPGRAPGVVATHPRAPRATQPLAQAVLDPLHRPCLTPCTSRRSAASPSQVACSTQLGPTWTHGPPGPLGHLDPWATWAPQAPRCNMHTLCTCTAFSRTGRGPYIMTTKSPLHGVVR